MPRDLTLTVQEWRREAKLLHIEDAEGLPNAHLAAKKFSEDGSTSTVVKSDGSRVQYRAGRKL